MAGLFPSRQIPLSSLVSHSLLWRTGRFAGPFSANTVRIAGFARRGQTGRAPKCTRRCGEASLALDPSSSIWRQLRVYLGF
jgi:hypothetical protein